MQTPNRSNVDNRAGMLNCDSWCFANASIQLLVDAVTRTGLIQPSVIKERFKKSPFLSERSKRGG